MVSIEQPPGFPNPACPQGKETHGDTDVSMDQKSTSAGLRVVEEPPVRSSIYRDVVLPQARVLVRAFCIHFRINFQEEYTQGIVDSALRGELKNALKYALAQPLAELTRYSVYEPVPRPSCVPETKSLYIVELLGLKGWERKKVLSRLMETTKEGDTPTDRSKKLCFEVLQLKNLAPKVLFPDLVSAVNDHRTALTSTEDLPPTKQCQLTYEQIVDHLVPLPVSFFKMPRAKYTDRSALLEIDSFRASQGVKRLRSGKGLKAELNEFETNPETGVSKLPPFSFQTSELHRMEDSPIQKTQSQNSRKTRLRQRTSNDFEIRRSVVPRDEEEFEFTEEFVQNARTTENEADIVALLEPLKVRTISIDSGILRAMSSRIQKWIHGEMRRSPVFSLIGGVSVEDAVKQFTLHVVLGFISGDYKGATDSIFGSHTDYVIEQIFKRISFPPHLLRHVAAMKRDVTGVILNYSKTLKSEGIPFLMEFEKRFWKHHGKENIGFLEGYVEHDRSATYGQLLTKLRDYISRKFPEYLCSFNQEITDDFQLNFEEGKLFKQTRGQLMGNILSFPVLCIINFATYLNTSLDFVKENLVKPFDLDEDLKMLENCRQFVFVSNTLKGDILTQRPELRFSSKKDVGGKRIAFTNVPVLINGDDILFQGSTRFYDLWSRKIGEVGFVKSVGKNYFSKEFCTINSQLLIPTYSRDVEGFKLTPWVGLDRVSTIWWSGISPDFLRKRTDLQALMGSSYIEQNVDVRSFLSIVQGVFLDSVKKTRRDDFNRLWLDNLDSEIKSFDSKTFLVSRTLPLSLGGLGLEFPKNNTENLTYSQKILAGRLNLADNPFGLTEKSVLQESMGKIIANIEKYKTVRRFPTNEMTLESDGLSGAQYFNNTEHETYPNIRYKKANELVLCEIANIIPTWRTPPPDTIVFKKEQLSIFTDRVFSWAMRCRADLRKKFAEDVRTHTETALYVKT